MYMLLDEFKNDYKRLRRRVMEAVYVKHRINIFRNGWYTRLYDDGNGNRIENPRWMDYIGTDHYKRFKTYYSKEPEYRKEHSRYKKTKQYLIDHSIRKQANEYVRYEVSGNCRIYTNKNQSKYG